MSQSMGTNFQLPVIFDPFFNVEREIITVKTEALQIHFHMSLCLSRKRGQYKTALSLFELPVPLRFSVDWWQNHRASRDENPCVKPSCHLLFPQIRVFYLFCRVAIISVISPNALLWVMDVTGQKKKSFHYHANSNERKKLSLDNSHIQKQLQTFLRTCVKSSNKKIYDRPEVMRFTVPVKVLTRRVQCIKSMVI